MEALTIVLTIIIICLAGALWWNHYYGMGSNTESFVPVGPISPNGTPASAFYGEDNPINSYAKKLNIEGSASMPDPGSMVLEGEPYSQGVLQSNDTSAHMFYIKSNSNRYPIQQRGDPTELRATRNGYVAGTRAMRAVPIRPDESVVPDKLERTVRPY